MARLTVAELQDMIVDLERDLTRQKQRYDTDVEDLRRQLNEALDAKGEVQASLDAVTMADLEKQQWWGLERKKLVDDREFWKAEAQVWAHHYAEYRQKVERYNAGLNMWVSRLQDFAKGGLYLDVLFMLMCILYVWRSGAPLWPQ